MPADLKYWREREQQRQEDRLSRQARRADLHGPGKTDKRRLTTRMRCFMGFMKVARFESPKPITAAVIAKRAHVSEAAFFTAFKDGVPGLLLVACEQIGHMAGKIAGLEVARRESNGEALGRPQRVSLAVAHLVRLVTHYPQLFNINGIIQREVIYALSAPLVDALNHGLTSEQERADAGLTAIYHTTALVGIMRSRLGEDISRERYTERVTYMTLSQLVPSVMIGGDAEVENIIQWAMDQQPPMAFHVPDSQGYQHVLAAWARKDSTGSR